MAQITLNQTTPVSWTSFAKFPRLDEVEDLWELKWTKTEFIISVI